MHISGSPIGIFLTPFKDLGQIPAQAGGSGIEVVIDVFPQHKAMLNDLREFRYVIVSYQIQGGEGNGHVVTSLLEMDKRSIFASESAPPSNPIGHSVIRLKGILGSLMIVEGVDALDQTPVLDIKPYLVRKGQTVLTLSENLGCTNAQCCFGLKDIDENEIKSHAKYTRDLEQAERFVRSKPRLPLGKLKKTRLTMNQCPQ